MVACTGQFTHLVFMSIKQSQVPVFHVLISLHCLLRTATYQITVFRNVTGHRPACRSSYFQFIFRPRTNSTAGLHLVVTLSMEIESNRSKALLRAQGCLRLDIPNLEIWAFTRSVCREPCIHVQRPGRTKNGVES